MPGTSFIVNENQNGINLICIFKGNNIMGCFLSGLRLYVPVNNFSVMSGRFPGLNQDQAMKVKRLAQGHNTAPMVSPALYQLS